MYVVPSSRLSTVLSLFVMVIPRSAYYLNVRSGKPEADKNIIKDKTLLLFIPTNPDSYYSFCVIYPDKPEFVKASLTVENQELFL